MNGAKGVQPGRGSRHSREQASRRSRLCVCYPHAERKAPDPHHLRAATPPRGGGEAEADLSGQPDPTGYRCPVRPRSPGRIGWPHSRRSRGLRAAFSPPTSSTSSLSVSENKHLSRSASFDVLRRHERHRVQRRPVGISPGLPRYLRCDRSRGGRRTDLTTALEEVWYIELSGRAGDLAGLAERPTPSSRRCYQLPTRPSGWHSNAERPSLVPMIVCTSARALPTGSR